MIMNNQSEFFRAGVGIVIVNANGSLLALRRADLLEEAWQLPQGGLGPGEEPETAMWRELEEETGLTQGNCELVAESEDWLAYELPQPFRSSKIGRGQTQRWYLCRFTGQDSDIAPDGREFNDWKWVQIDQLVTDVVPFRRSVYQSIAAEFADYLS